ncbi:MAG: RDD family protein [Arenimonas sp.]
MAESFWHYTDSRGTEHGPVTADAVRAAIDEGRIGPASQFWHEGLPGWIDRATAAGALGIGTDAPLPPPDPYAAPRADVGAAEVRFIPGGEVVPAGFVRRFASWFLDWMILSVFLFVLAAVGAGVMGVWGQGDGAAGVAFAVVYYLVYFGGAALYYATQESSFHQATLGKRALGIKVADREGRRLGFGHAIGRWFAAALSYLTLCFGFLMAAFPPRKAALHDRVAGAQVVDRWAYTDTPEKQQRELSGCLVVVLVALMLAPIVFGILTVIAVSQFEQFEQRARSGSMLEPEPAKHIVVSAAPAERLAFSDPPADLRPARSAHGAGSSSTPTPS